MDPLIKVLEKIRMRMQLFPLQVPPGPQGCSEEELLKLEIRYAVKLPLTYRRYLQEMGHILGHLTSLRDHQEVSYASVMEMTFEVRQDWDRMQMDSGVSLSSSLELPSDALVIDGRLGDQFEFIRCSKPDDSPVWYFNTWEWQQKQSHSSVVSWLDGFTSL
jgi:hypothetical protein